MTTTIHVDTHAGWAVEVSFHEPEIFAGVRSSGRVIREPLIVPPGQNIPVHVWADQMISCRELTHAEWGEILSKGSAAAETAQNAFEWSKDAET